jgi:hypothetical protein
VFPGVLVPTPPSSAGAAGYVGGSLIGNQGIATAVDFTVWNAINMAIPGVVSSPLDGLPLGKLWRHRSPNQLLPGPYPIRALCSFFWTPGAATGFIRLRMTAEVLRILDPQVGTTEVDTVIGETIGFPRNVQPVPGAVISEHVAILPFVPWGFQQGKLLQIRIQPEVLGPPFFPVGTGVLTSFTTTQGAFSPADAAFPPFRLEIDTDQDG